MIIAQGPEGAREGYELSGPFEVYGTQEELLIFATQLRYGALQVEIGWVPIDTSICTSPETIEKWKEK